MSQVAERIGRSGPKKILACDGGGILGLVLAETLRVELNRALGHPDGVPPERVQVMDSVRHIAEIQRVGARYAERHVSLDHLVPFVATSDGRPSS